MCLTNPITIPVGANGKSVTIAFASTSTGTGFSYTPSSSLPYISFVSKTGTVATTDFTTWVKYLGTDGTNGTNGTSVTSVSVSNGITAIGGTVYAINTVVVLLSSGTYVNAGVINLSPTWTSMTMLNGWSSTTAAYTIHNGFIYFRGAASAAAATSIIFANITTGLTISVDSTVTTAGSPADTSPDTSQFTIAYTTGNLSIERGLTIPGTYWLDSIPPISIR